MTPDPHTGLNPVVRQFIEQAGHASQSFGVGRVLGQIFAYLYLSPEPRTLNDMQTAVGISKGSASTGVRQLEQWGAVHKVWVKGDRKDYYEANDWFGRIIKSVIVDTVGTKMSVYNAFLENIERELADIDGDGEGEFVKERVEHLRSFQQRAQKLWNNPVMQRLLR